MKAHFIGIAGKGMSATALLLKEKGWEISGSDEGAYPPVSTYLEHAGIVYARGYKKENIPADADIIVIGKNARLTQESNEEVRAAFESGKKVCSFPDVVSDLTRHTDNIVVAGSYGKSTTTALLAWCLMQAGKDPSYFVGEITKGFDAHAHLGSSNTFILEGDEYPSSNWDASPKFLHYNAKSILLTSATHDHVNIYPTHESYLTPFTQLISSLPQDGLVVASGTEAFAKHLAAEYRGEVVLYGMDASLPWHAANIAHGEETTFELVHDGAVLVSIRTSLLGLHNIENIVGAGAMLLHKKLLMPEEFAKGAASFQGVKRRMELLSRGSSVPVVEGFGSSYEKARSAIAAMQAHYPGPLRVVFEPNTIGWRSRANIEQYDSVFAGAQKVYVFNPPHDGKATELSDEDIATRVEASGIASIAGDADAILGALKNDTQSGDSILLLSSGAMGGLAESIPLFAENTFPTNA